MVVFTALSSGFLLSRRRWSIAAAACDTGGAARSPAARVHRHDGGAPQHRTGAWVCLYGLTLVMLLCLASVLPYRPARRPRGAASWAALGALGGLALGLRPAQLHGGGRGRRVRGRLGPHLRVHPVARRGPSAPCSAGRSSCVVTVTAPDGAGSPMRRCCSPRSWCWGSCTPSPSSRTASAVARSVYPSSPCSGDSRSPVGDRRGGGPSPGSASRRASWCGCSSPCWSAGRASPWTHRTVCGLACSTRPPVTFALAASVPHRPTGRRATPVPAALQTPITKAPRRRRREYAVVDAVLATHGRGHRCTHGPQHVTASQETLRNARASRRRVSAGVHRGSDVISEGTRVALQSRVRQRHEGERRSTVEIPSSRRRRPTRESRRRTASPLVAGRAGPRR